MYTPVYSPHPWGSPLRGQPSAVQNRSGRFCLATVRLALPALAGVLKHALRHFAKRSRAFESVASRAKYRTGDTIRNFGSVRSETLVAALILRLDITGQPLRWIPWQQAVMLQTKEMVAWDAGDIVFTFHGGVNRLTGRRSQIRVNSIIAVRGTPRFQGTKESIPPLSNRQLFLRDHHLCMYCGKQLPEHLLTRDHLVPLSRGGKDCWSNVVTACRACNHTKGAHTPEEAQMTLLAVPFVPNRAEYLVLSNRRILLDQMEFLRKRFRRGSRLRDLQ